jgi:hypothetical protein
MTAPENSAEAQVIFSAGKAAGLGCGLSFIVSPLVTLVQITLIFGAWSICDIGVNNSANSLVLLLIWAPVLLVFNTAVLPLALWLSTRMINILSAPWRKYRAIPIVLVSTFTLFISIVGFASILWAAMAYAIPGTDYPTQCVNNTPRWWPSIFPV